MKISQEMNAQLETAKKNIRTTADGKQGFRNIVQSETHKLKQDGMQKLLEGISLQGEKLARFRSFRDLAKFKQMVRSFLKEAVANGFDLQKSYGFSMSGHAGNLTTVKEIDRKLVQLTEDVLDKEKKSVDLLGTIGEIKGLLINIYM
ncbi:YaaR family protein [Virgibacillus sp. 179-BFC.A HS]|uniref:YaaR family protein n=1 Tax=Tigheibacillus jepli TaxID=3035914 RepID=A0ABU5CCR1_9BACI|nr:YaaR family protein [Virgibacillus sp. 179-BFC.A HS]MDY0404056.1 YaaR family protein [Virgibacillus sp. 179-BFC.A HS]